MNLLTSEDFGKVSRRNSGQIGKFDSLTCKFGLKAIRSWFSCRCIMEVTALLNAWSNRGSIFLGSASRRWLSWLSVDSISSRVFTTTEKCSDESSWNKIRTMSPLWCSSRNSWRTTTFPSISWQLTCDSSITLICCNDQLRIFRHAPKQLKLVPVSQQIDPAALVPTPRRSGGERGGHLDLFTEFLQLKSEVLA